MLLSSVCCCGGGGGGGGGIPGADCGSPRLTTPLPRLDSLPESLPARLAGRLGGGGGIISASDSGEGTPERPGSRWLLGGGVEVRELLAPAAVAVLLEALASFCGSCTQHAHACNDALSVRGLLLVCSIVLAHACACGVRGVGGREQQQTNVRDAHVHGRGSERTRSWRSFSCTRLCSSLSLSPLRRKVFQPRPFPMKNLNGSLSSGTECHPLSM
jgi:hypothetical protein